MRIEKILRHNLTIISPNKRVPYLLLMFDWEVVLDPRPWHLTGKPWLENVVVAGITVDIPRSTDSPKLREKAQFISEMSIPLLISLYTPAIIGVIGFSASANLALMLAGLSKHISRMALIDPIPHGPIPEDLHHIRRSYILTTRGIWSESLIGKLSHGVKRVIYKDKFEDHSPDIYRTHAPEAVKFIFGDSRWER